MPWNPLWLPSLIQEPDWPWLSPQDTQLHLLWPWLGSLTSLSLSFLIHRILIIIVPTLQIVLRGEQEKHIKFLYIAGTP